MLGENVKKKKHPPAWNEGEKKSHWSSSDQEVLNYFFTVPPSKEKKKEGKKNTHKIKNKQWSPNYCHFLNNMFHLTGINWYIRQDSY